MLPAQAILLEFFIALAAVRELTNMPLMNVELLKLGLRIRASRNILGLSQKVFSKECGVDRSYFGGVERGERNLTFPSLCQICAGLNRDIAAVTKGIPYLRAGGNGGGPWDQRETTSFQRNRRPFALFLCKGPHTV